MLIVVTIQANFHKKETDEWSYGDQALQHFSHWGFLYQADAHVKPEMYAFDLNLLLIMFLASVLFVFTHEDGINHSGSHMAVPAGNPLPWLSGDYK